MENNEQITTETQTPESTPVEQVNNEPQIETDNERTKIEFEKLITANKELKEEAKKYKSVLDSLSPVEEVPQPKATEYTNLKQDDIDAVFEGMVEDGFIDGEKLKGTLREMDARTRKAEEQAQRVAEHQERERIAREQQIKSDEMRRVHEKYPALDPNSNEFNPKFFELVRNDLIGQMIKGTENVMEAADKWADTIMPKKEEPVLSEEEEVKKKETVAKKQQINAARPRSNMASGYYASDENEALKKMVMHGKKGAIAEMLRRREQGKL